jgi:methylmalonyl-CoA mutase cobalamin-binding domain/chain
MPVTRRQRTSVVVLAGDGVGTDLGARALVRSLRHAGVEIVYLGREPSARRIAITATHAGAQAVEVCVLGGGAMRLLRDLLRELKRLDRGHVSVVVHRIV